MPANVVHTDKDEAAWNRAKATIHRQYDFSEDNDRFWALVQHVYQNMKALNPEAGDMQKSRRYVVIVREGRLCRVS